MTAASRSVTGTAELLLREYVRRRDTADPPRSPLKLPARDFKPLPGGDYAVSLRFESDPTERIFGMGQYQHEFLDLKNCTLELAHRNSQSSVPFALSSLGYGMLWNNPAIGRVTFARNVTEWQAFSTRQLDVWITVGDTPAEIVEAYARATGTVPLMPETALGLWQSKLRYRTQQELLEVAREYVQRDLPLAFIVADFMHWDRQGDWAFDPRDWPDPAAMVDELRSMGIELLVSVWPTVDKSGRRYPEMLRDGYLIRTERGLRTTMEFMGSTVFVDVTNPDARRYFWDAIRAGYWDAGVRHFWLDEAEPEYPVYDFDHYRYHLGSDLQIGNLYPLLFAKTFFDGLTEAGDTQPMSLVRATWAGGQRYGALVWSGDTDTTWTSFRQQVRAGLNMGLAGIPVVDLRHRRLPRRLRRRPSLSRARDEVVPVRGVLPRPPDARRSGAAYRARPVTRGGQPRDRRTKRALGLRRGHVGDPAPMARDPRAPAPLRPYPHARGPRARDTAHASAVLRLSGRSAGVGRRRRIHVRARPVGRPRSRSGRLPARGVPPGWDRVARRMDWRRP